MDDLGFTTPTGTVTANSSNNNDFNATNPCPSCVSGCTINFVTNGGSVPAGQHVVVFTSRNLNYLTYDLSGLCIGGQIYCLWLMPHRGQVSLPIGLLEVARVVIHLQVTPTELQP
ncbi:MAG: hypothetical protein IPK25_14400 [Saprospiraceae bacterium]|nr:hypothetical protein [Saprospiraceae bacterium]